MSPVFKRLHVYNPRERLMVGCADALLGVLALAGRPFSRRTSAGAPRRILLLRLERIGDLLMTLGALQAVRARAPAARIHLVVGSWNADLVRLLPSVDSHETLDAPWLARRGSAASATALASRAWKWRAERFDLALNFEPDIRSNLLLGLSGASRRIGFASAGGGSVLSEAIDYNPRTHTAANLLRLVDAALPPLDGDVTPASGFPRLQVPDAAREEARRLLGIAAGRPLMVGLHVSGGRTIKQWHLDRFAQVGTRLARELAAALVLTGTADDRPLVDRVAADLPPDVPVIDVAGAMSLPVLAAVLEQLGLFVTGDTGPMHLAAAVGTPTVAIFGPSDPVRYGPLTDHARVLTADLWCRPCNRIRRPPERCTHGVPDCLSAIDVDAVCRAAHDLLGVTSR